MIPNEGVQFPAVAPDQQRNFQSVLLLAQTCEFEVNHTLNVTQLALRLFGDLEPLHHLGPRERHWLIYASILHDIGWIEGWKEHHKVALRIILSTPMLTFSNKERLVIGSVARYHRKSLPDIKHDHYAALSPAERQVVCMLAGCLRLADGLDHTHQQRVQDLSCKVSAKRIVITCCGAVPDPDDSDMAQAKSDLLSRACRRKITLKGLI
jgi:exopolyphosphatase/pppGpp-phosphohydrolase